MNGHAYKLLVLSFLIGCGNGSDKSGNASGKSSDLVDSFKAVNASLESSGKDLNARVNFEFFHSQIKQKSAANPERVKKADSLFLATDSLLVLIDTITVALQKSDSTGDNMDIAGKLLLHTRLGDNLRSRLLNVYDCCYAGIVSKDRVSGLDSCLGRLKDIKSDPNWSERYFNNTPSAGAITILYNLRSECLKAASLTMSDVYNNID